MSHDHQHGHAHGGSNIGVAFFLNLSFTVIEIIGGFWTNSFAILSDALHDLGDSLSLGLAWYFQKLSKRGRTPAFTYGYKRFNTLGAIVTGTMLVGGLGVYPHPGHPGAFRSPTHRCRRHDLACRAGHPGQRGGRFSPP